MEEDYLQDISPEQIGRLRGLSSGGSKRPSYAKSLIGSWNRSAEQTP